MSFSRDIILHFHIFSYIMCNFCHIFFICRLNTCEFVYTSANPLIRNCYCYHPQADYELFKSLAGDEEGKCLEYIEWTLGKIHSVSNLQLNSQPLNNQATLEMLESRHCTEVSVMGRQGCNIITLFCGGCKISYLWKILNLGYVCTKIKIYSIKQKPKRNRDQRHVVWCPTLAVHVLVTCWICHMTCPLVHVSLNIVESHNRNQMLAVTQMT